MTTALVILGVLAALFLAAALATRPDQALAPAPPDAADVVLPERVGADDVRGLRFGLAARGYRMSEVDAALERLAGELEERDRRLAELSGGVPVDDAAAPSDIVVDAAPGSAAAGGAAPVGDVLLEPTTDGGPVEVDGITTAGLTGAGVGMDPLLPSVPAPGPVSTPPTSPDGTSLPADPAALAGGPTSPDADPSALAAGEAGAAAADVPAPVLEDDVFPVADGPGVPRPVDPPARRG